MSGLLLTDNFKIVLNIANYIVRCRISLYSADHCCGEAAPLNMGYKFLHSDLLLQPKSQNRLLGILSHIHVYADNNSFGRISLIRCHFPVATQEVHDSRPQI